MENMNDIIKELELLKEVDDCFGFNFGNGKGLFVQVLDDGDGKYYLLEANDVNEDGAFEPYSSCNGSCEFGNIEAFKEELLSFNNQYKMW